MTKEARLLTLLSDRQWHLTREMNVITYRYSSYICEWRKVGYDIEGECVDHATGLWRFRLVSTPDQAALAPGLARTNETLERLLAERERAAAELAASKPKELAFD